LKIEGEDLKTHCLHSDLNPGNMLYSTRKKLLQLIDFGTMAYFLQRVEASSFSIDFTHLLLYDMIAFLEIDTLAENKRKLPQFNFLTSFLRSYIKESGLEEEAIKPLLYNYSMTLLADIETGKINELFNKIKMHYPKYPSDSDGSSDDSDEGLDDSDEGLDDIAEGLDDADKGLDEKGREGRTIVFEEFDRHLRKELKISDIVKKHSRLTALQPN
jgi:hypothetical protein